MHVYLEFEAGAWIREHGGAVYLWDDDFGNFGLDRLATEDPGGIEFEPHYAGEGVTVFVDARLEPPQALRVELRRRPFRGLRVYWDGLRWGARGSAADGDGGGG